MIRAHEGLRTTAYLDPVGIPTVCYGHTGPNVRLGQRYSAAQCEAILMEDIRKHQVYLTGPRNCIRSAPLNANQRDALTSFVFNIGGPRFCGSTLARKLAARDYPGAAAEFPRWRFARVRGENVVLRGLERRRRDEQSLFLTPVAAASPAPVSGRLRAILVAAGQ